jgi:hypothetical protein
MLNYLKPEQIYLLELFSSAAYFSELRDTWAAMIRHVETCLDSYVRKLPSSYRKRHLSEQPDVVWGERVLPNFRETLHGMDNGYILLTHGDVSGLSYAHGPRNDFKGQLDFWSGWMTASELAQYEALIDKAMAMAHNIVLTEGAYWDRLDLADYDNEWAPIKVPWEWPTYRINKDIAVKSGEKTVQSGIYLPDLANSCAEFLSTEYAAAPQGKVHVGYENFADEDSEERDEQPVFENRDCVWYLVERAGNLRSTAEHPGSDDGENRRVAAGHACPETGYYFTPARPNSRKLFREGDVMPTFDSTYGTIIWQWDVDQGMV